MFELEPIAIGLFTGGAYSLIAVSITLMFRSTGVLSFAHASFAAVGAFVYVDLAGEVGETGWPKPLAALAAIVVSTAYGLVVERLAIRPVRGAPPATRLIATLAVLTLTTSALLWRYGFEPRSAPLLLADETVGIGDARFGYQQVAVLVTAAVSAAALAVFLYRTRFGTAVRATATDSEAARLCGVAPVRIAQFNWGLAAFLASTAGVLVAPLQLLSVGTFPLLLAKSLAGALLGGLGSIGLAFVGGLSVGVLESVTVTRSSTPGGPELATMAFVVAILVLRRRWVVGARPEPVARPPGRLTVPAGLVSWWHTAAAPIAAAGAVIAVAVPANSSYWAFVGGRAVFFAIEVLSIVIITGWGGQVSLMQGAYVGIGAFGTAYLVDDRGFGLAAALLVSALAGTAMGAIAGLPALRLGGLQFAVASLVFSGAAAAWLFEWRELPGSLPRGDLLGIDLSSDIAVYFVMLGVALVLFGVAGNVRRSTHGSLLLAARDDPDTVTSFGASAGRTRMGAFLLASFTATLGGGLYAVLVSGINPRDFSLLLSLSLLVYTVVGGLRSLGGPILAALAFGLVPQLLQVRAGSSASAVPDIVAGAAVILLVAVRPAGLASMFHLGGAAEVRDDRRVEAGRIARARLARITPPTPAAVAAFAAHRRPVRPERLP
ncbi:ABC transporter permease [Iamia sp. SCSIO 61187]|uniref:ABC transporter permease n=1 Tax=Iamia sp. SCSIO 61187 TaxID=2722752 RepID=UPI001C634081|nr:ABC transporter permease [Iamia sp. SCSIO 61187]QYG94494.1 ABC transporter permease [Iamia sp. SCSIO 61187]